MTNLDRKTTILLHIQKYLRALLLLKEKIFLMKGKKKNVINL